jgi:hypothetical protein
MRLEAMAHKWNPARQRKSGGTRARRQMPPPDRPEIIEQIYVPVELPRELRVVQGSLQYCGGCPRIHFARGDSTCYQPVLVNCNLWKVSIS